MRTECGCRALSRHPRIQRVTVTALALLFACGATTPAPRGAPATAPAMPEAAQRAFDLVNDRRSASGLPALALDAGCAAAAQAHAEDMFARDFFSHDSPTERYAARLARHGLPRGSVGENIGLASTPEEVVDAWMRSPPHRENILRPVFRAAGMGFAGDRYVLCLLSAPGVTPDRKPPRK